MIVEFPNDRISGHCSNIYIRPIMLGCDLQGTSFPFLFQAVADRLFCYPILLLTMEVRFIWLYINLCMRSNIDPKYE